MSSRHSVNKKTMRKTMSVVNVSFSFLVKNTVSDLPKDIAPIQRPPKEELLARHVS